jgi:hypothetical protein
MRGKCAANAAITINGNARTPHNRHISSPTPDESDNKLTLPGENENQVKPSLANK